MHGQHRSIDHLNVVRTGEFGNGSIIAFDVFKPHGAGVTGDVVGAGKDYDSFGMKFDHVGAQADEQLRSGLSADATVNVGLAWKEFVELPEIGDGVAEKNNP